jgi:hypothetical protein
VEVLRTTPEVLRTTRMSIIDLHQWINILDKEP